MTSLKHSVYSGKTVSPLLSRSASQNYSAFAIGGVRIATPAADGDIYVEVSIIGVPFMMRM
jgi:hypothetical protein